jgi:hypothetical protein
MTTANTNNKTIIYKSSNRDTSVSGLPTENILQIPIFVYEQSLFRYANHVRELLLSKFKKEHTTMKVCCELIFMDPNPDQYLVSEPFHSKIRRTPFSLVILNRHGTEFVAMRAILPDGTCPGFMDTHLNDAIAYISHYAATPVPTNPFPFSAEGNQVKPSFRPDTAQLLNSAQSLLKEPTLGEQSKIFLQKIADTLTTQPQNHMPRAVPSITRYTIYSGTTAHSKASNEEGRLNDDNRTPVHLLLNGLTSKN